VYRRAPPTLTPKAINPNGAQPYQYTELSTHWKRRFLTSQYSSYPIDSQDSSWRRANHSTVQAEAHSSTSQREHLTRRCTTSGARLTRSALVDVNARSHVGGASLFCAAPAFTSHSTLKPSSFTSHLLSTIYCASEHIIPSKHPPPAWRLLRWPIGECRESDCLQHLG
jgi:hypothetical protein